MFVPKVNKIKLNTSFPWVEDVYLFIFAFKFSTMNTYKFTKYATLIISILTASLLNEYIVGYVNSHYKSRTYLSVLIGMAVTLLIFVPVFGIVRKWMDTATKTYLKTSKKIAKKNNTGLFWGFLIAFAVLFVLFAKIRHGIDVLSRINSAI